MLVRFSLKENRIPGIHAEDTVTVESVEYPSLSVETGR
jgi:hypothetical protein